MLINKRAAEGVKIFHGLVKYCGTIQQADTKTIKGNKIVGFARYGKPSATKPNECDSQVVNLPDDGGAWSDKQFEPSWDDGMICEL